MGDGPFRYNNCEQWIVLMGGCYLPPSQGFEGGGKQVGNQT